MSSKGNTAFSFIVLPSTTTAAPLPSSSGCSLGEQQRMLFSRAAAWTSKPASHCGEHTPTRTNRRIFSVGQSIDH